MSHDIIFENINRIDSSIAKIYQGALVVLENKNNPDRIHQSAHSLRETINRLVGHIKIEPTENNDNESKIKFKMKLLQKFDPLGGPPKEFQNVYNKLSDLQKWFVATSHHGYFPEENEYLVKIDEFQKTLGKFFEPYFETISKLSDILKRSPTQDEFNNLINIITTYASLKFFFDNINEKWYPLLTKNNVFKNPPPIDKTSNTVQIWPQSKYLIRIAGNNSEAVYNIIKNCKMPILAEDRNYYVIEDFLEIAEVMEKQYSVPLINDLIKKDWINSPYVSRIYDNAINISKKFMKENALESKKIIENLLSIRKVKEFKDRKDFVEFYEKFKDNPFEKINDYYFRKIKDENFLNLFEKFPEETIIFFVDTLDRILTTFIELEKFYKKNKKRERLFLITPPKSLTISDLWLQSINIEDDFSDIYDFKVMIIYLISEGLRRIGRDIKKLRKIMLVIGKKKFFIFRRIELYVYSIYPELFNQEINKAILSNINNIELYHEHYNLVSNTFHSRTKAIRIKYIKKISSIMDSKKFCYPLLKMGYDESRIKSYKNNWKLKRFEPIYKFLSSEEQKWYDENRQNDDGFIPKGKLWHMEIMTDVKDGKDIGLTENMKPQEVLKLLQLYVQEEDFKDSADDITSEKFENLVKRNPKEYSEVADNFKEINTSYCYHLIKALGDAVNEGSSINWEKIVDLCYYLLENQNLPFSPGINFLHGSNPIARILFLGLNKETSGLSFKFRNTIWYLCQLHLEKTISINTIYNNDEEVKTNYLFNICNSPLGSTIQLILEYGLWCCINLHKINNKYEIVSEVIETLESILSYNRIAIQSMIALYLGNFLIPADKDWVKNNLSRIFPLWYKNKIMYYSVWECYLKGRFTRLNFEIMYKLYLERIKILKKDSPCYHDSEEIQILTTHIINAYIHNLENGDALYEEFLRYAPKKIISISLGEISRLLLKRKQGKQYKFSLNQLQKIRNRKELANNQEFLKWFVYNPFDKKYALKKVHELLKIIENEKLKNYIILSEVAEELVNYTEIDVDTTLDSIMLLAKISNNHNILHIIKDSALNIIRNSKNNSDVVERNHISEIKNFFGKCGFNEFKNL